MVHRRGGVVPASRRGAGRDVHLRRSGPVLRRRRSVGRVEPVAAASRLRRRPPGAVDPTDRPRNGERRQVDFGDRPVRSRRRAGGSRSDRHRQQRLSARRHERRSGQGRTVAVGRSVGPDRRSTVGQAGEGDRDGGEADRHPRGAAAGVGQSDGNRRNPAHAHQRRRIADDRQAAVGIGRGREHRRRDPHLGRPARSTRLRNRFLIQDRHPPAVGRGRRSAQGR